MKLRLLTIFMLFAVPFAVAAQSGKTVRFKKLPPNVTPATAVWGKMVRLGVDVFGPERTTVEKRLRELKAKYKKNVLVDAKGRQIKFWEPQCRGVSAGRDEDEAEQKSAAEELAALKVKFTVIELVCDPARVGFEFRKQRFRPETRNMKLEILL